MPVVDKNPDGSTAVRIFYTDLSVEAVEEIDNALTEMGHGILYDHVIEEFALVNLEIDSDEEEETTPRRLPTIKIDDKEYFVDKRLGEIRNVNNPHDSKPISYIRLA